MCGLAGILGLNGTAVDPPVLQQMTDRLSHRGPDGEGFVLGAPWSGGFRHVRLPHTRAWSTASPVTVALGHRRLAILDLSERGNQPMGSPDERVWIVFNGEIYNHLELRDAFEQRGVAFRTRTDTEVLLHAYLRWGDACLDHLEGMYAFAIWDSVLGRLFCARDRLGIKPFYYTIAGGQFIFGSEIKALLANPAVSSAADDEAVLGFLIHSNCDYGERTVFRHIKALPAAHVLTVDVQAERVSVRRYWQLDPAAAASAHMVNGARIERLQELLLSTIRKHLISDVRAGSCLSGGLDSSTVVGLISKVWHEEPEAARAIGERFHTFTSCYEQKEFDEREHALNVAHAAGATPHLVFPAAEAFWNDFERMAWHQDMPFGCLSYYAQWRVMQEARDAGVKVLLDGQGGDEVFGGYAKFRYAYLISLARSGRLPHMLRELAGTLRQGDRYVLDLRNGYRYLPGSLRKLFNVDSVLKQVMRADWATAVSLESTPATRWWRYAVSTGNGGTGWSFCQRMQVDDIVVDTLPQLLRMEDRSSMAFSLEARVPLLDHRLVEYGVALPDEYKFHNGWSKFAIREATRDLMPESVRLRKSKLGFAAPDRLWLLSDLHQQIHEFLSCDTLRCTTYIDAAALRRWYSSPEARVANTESYLGLFRVLSLEMWMRAFRV